jgi:thiamine monophosphate synthase
VGGITADRIAGCIAAGASGVVVRSGILLSENPAESAKRYCDEIAFAWEKRTSRID